MHIAYIGLGSNLGDRAAHIERAVTQLGDTDDITVTACSPLYESAAMHGKTPAPDDPPYLNAAAALETTLSPETLLERLLEIEVAMGRPAQHQKDAPRTIDLDLLFYDDLVQEAKTLTLPHPEAGKRVFVLLPLCDIAPLFVHPVTKVSVRTMCERLQAESNMTATRWNKK